ncbi:uncharacterized protein LOC119397194 [Rhipicephalus sanguineus]|uniref:uncharacterized protein LOC119397194 n=1 Tax=Rhipicephalus sanguineus TaxID=34632 RepID=UPI0018962B64|nr:uncharacterized protein LOC119397194 [Rhipicephalus sanguineus]
MSSDDIGAASAAQQGRGTRNMDESSQEYQIILPRLPSGDATLHTVFLHADIRARPYRVEDFSDALIRLALLPEVATLGAYQMNHVWAITFKSAEGKKKMLAAGDIAVKNQRCIAIDPSHQDTRLKIHWLLYNVPDDDVRAVLAPYGKVHEIVRERWRVYGCTDKGSSTRAVSLKLKPGLTVDDLPHQLRIAGDLTLVVVAGRAPLCLRCQGTGHIRRECRAPRCAVCRRFGHDQSGCSRTYASVAGPVGSEELSEHHMDEVEAEELTGGRREESTPRLTPLFSRPLSAASTGGKDKGPANEGQLTKSTQGATTPKTKEEMQENMDTSSTNKRTREEAEGKKVNVMKASEEPPAKANIVRRKPAPNVLSERRIAETEPPTQLQQQQEQAQQQQTVDQVQTQQQQPLPKQQTLQQRQTSHHQQQLLQQQQMPSTGSPSNQQPP